MNEIFALKRQGLTVSAISVVTGYSRPTIRKYLDNPKTPQYGPRQPRLSLLDAFKPYLKERLAAGVWNAVVLLKEITERGYQGGYTALKDYLRPLREAGRCVAVRRFETPPGKQAQVDWGDMGDITYPDETRHKLNAFVMTLGYSRAMFADIAFQPRVDERLVRELATLAFVREGNNVILLGPPGVGKTHLATGLAVAAIEGGYSAYFVTAHTLVSDLGKAAREGKLEARLRHYLKCRVLVVDEVGYLPLDSLGATIFFQLVSARYEKGSIVLTSNTSYADWGQVFGETTIASAILDRLLHHSTTINIRGESYRLKERKKAGLLSAPRASSDLTKKS